MRTNARFTAWTFALCALVAAAPRLALADGAAERAVMLAQIQDAESKLLDLVEATPPAKMTWRTGKDVRSAAEIFLHVAQANYYAPTMFGVNPPEGVKIEGFDKSTTDKAAIVKALKDSFAHARKAIESASDADMDKAIKLFGHDATERAAMMVLVTHAHEHLGQSIAYARMNRITPPWTAREEAAAAAEKADKK